MSVCRKHVHLFNDTSHMSPALLAQISTWVELKVLLEYICENMREEKINKKYIFFLFLKKETRSPESFWMTVPWTGYQISNTLQRGWCGEQTSASGLAMVFQLPSLFHLTQVHTVSQWAEARHPWLVSIPREKRVKKWVTQKLCITERWRKKNYYPWTSKAAWNFWLKFTRYIYMALATFWF